MTPAPWTPYCGIAPAPGELWARWNLDPVLIGVLAIGGWLLWMPGGEQRGRRLAGLAMLAILFVSPLCALTSALFSARTAHHLVMTALAAPLLVSGLLPRRPVTGMQIAAAVTLHALALWFWTVPDLYAAALRSTALYWLMQASLLASACWLWRAILSAPALEAVAGLGATIGQMTILGALLSFAGRPLYAPHALTASAFRLGPLEDQQLAGVIMWLPGSVPYALTLLLLLGRWLEQQGRAKTSLATDRS